MILIFLEFINLKSKPPRAVEKQCDFIQIKKIYKWSILHSQWGLGMDGGYLPNLTRYSNLWNLSERARTSTIKYAPPTTLQWEQEDLYHGHRIVLPWHLFVKMYCMDEPCSRYSPVVSRHTYLTRTPLIKVWINFEIGNFIIWTIHIPQTGQEITVRHSSFFNGIQG